MLSKIHSYRLHTSILLEVYGFRRLRERFFCPSLAKITLFYQKLLKLGTLVVRLIFIDKKRVLKMMTY